MQARIEVRIVLGPAALPVADVTVAVEPHPLGNPGYDAEDLQAGLEAAGARVIAAALLAAGR